jgi:hypothetical protein
MKLQTVLNLPADFGSFRTRLSDVLVQIAKQLNGVTEGTLSADHSARTAAPTTGTWAQGDKVQNSAPTEAGGVGAKYVIVGWVCTVSGTPGTWLERRTLTGN